MTDQLLARVLAEKFHAGQMYGKNPYTYHLRAVVDSVGLAETDERLLVVAWLHDILEDTTCTASTLYTLFEDNIVKAVIAMTKQPTESREDYLAYLKQNPMAIKVKRHDALCNLTESIRRGDNKRTVKYAELLKELAS